MGRCAVILATVYCTGLEVLHHTALHYTALDRTDPQPRTDLVALGARTRLVHCSMSLSSSPAPGSPALLCPVLSAVYSIVMCVLGWGHWVHLKPPCPSRGHVRGLQYQGLPSLRQPFSVCCSPPLQRLSTTLYSWICSCGP